MDEGVVEVSFTGEASDLLANEFDCLAVTVDRGVTRLRVVGGDPAALHGILDQIDSLGLGLVSVRKLHE